MSVAEHADDAAALLDGLGATPALVIARSYGGEVATDLALRYPDRVRALVLLEARRLSSSPRRPSGRVPFGTASATSQRRPASMPSARR